MTIKTAHQLQSGLTTFLIFIRGPTLVAYSKIISCKILFVVSYPTDSNFKGVFFLKIPPFTLFAISVSGGDRLKFGGQKMKNIYVIN